MECKKHLFALLKQNIVKAAAIPLEIIRTYIEQWPERLCSCFESEGGGEI